MEWFKLHSDSAMILIVLIAGGLWLNGKFNDIEKDITIIKTMLIMKNITPMEK